MLNKIKFRVFPIVASVLLALSPIMIAGCSTVEGAGQDLQDASDAGRDVING